MFTLFLFTLQKTIGGREDSVDYMLSPSKVKETVCLIPLVQRSTYFPGQRSKGQKYSRDNNIMKIPSFSFVLTNIFLPTGAIYWPEEGSTFFFLNMFMTWGICIYFYNEITLIYHSHHYIVSELFHFSLPHCCIKVSIQHWTHKKNTWVPSAKCM